MLGGLERSSQLTVETRAAGVAADLASLAELIEAIYQPFSGKISALLPLSRFKAATGDAAVQLAASLRDLPVFRDNLLIQAVNVLENFRGLSDTEKQQGFATVMACIKHYPKQVVAREILAPLLTADVFIEPQAHDVFLCLCDSLNSAKKGDPLLPAVSAFLADMWKLHRKDVREALLALLPHSIFVTLARSQATYVQLVSEVF